METEILVGDIMGKGVITISPSDSVRYACKLMDKHDISGITVVEEGELVGMVTQGDLISVIAREENPSNVNVAKVMGTKCVCIDPGVDISEAAHAMVENKVKRLAVVRDGQLIGILTQTDIVRVSSSVYDLIFEKGKNEAGNTLEDVMGLSGECEECENFSDNLRSFNGELVCAECFKGLKEA